MLNRVGYYKAIIITLLLYNFLIISYYFIAFGLLKNMDIKIIIALIKIKLTNIKFLINLLRIETILIILSIIFNTR